MESVNRKLIRPSFNEIKEQIAPRRAPTKKPVPPDQTNAENFYYVKQMQSKTPMVFVLRDGETLHGGESLQIPPHAPHMVEALEDSVAVDLFSPIREDWIRGDDAYLRGGR